MFQHGSNCTHAANCIDGIGRTGIARVRTYEGTAVYELQDAERASEGAGESAKTKKKTNECARAEERGRRWRVKRACRCRAVKRMYHTVQGGVGVGAWRAWGWVETKNHRKRDLERDWEPCPDADADRPGRAAAEDRTDAAAEPGGVDKSSQSGRRAGERTGRGGGGGAVRGAVDACTGARRGGGVCGARRGGRGCICADAESDRDREEKDVEEGKEEEMASGGSGMGRAGGGFAGLRGVVRVRRRGMGTGLAGGGYGYEPSFAWKKVTGSGSASVLLLADQRRTRARGKPTPKGSSEAGEEGHEEEEVLRDGVGDGANDEKEDECECEECEAVYGSDGVDLHGEVGRPLRYGDVRSYCATSGRYGTNSLSPWDAFWKDTERRISGMRYSDELGRALALGRGVGRFTSFLSFLSSWRTRELLCGGASSNEKRRDALRASSGSGESSAAETRSPNSVRENGGARGDEGERSMGGGGGGRKARN
ncbi:hypothetical protein DFH09DRAFT_1288755 [Mycena vulgaris]|nr:hypothetical protein DFH09DRAFT_1288755 [Mycena vulgaris]